MFCLICNDASAPLRTNLSAQLISYCFLKMFEIEADLTILRTGSHLSEVLCFCSACEALVTTCMEHFRLISKVKSDIDDVKERLSQRIPGSDVQVPDYFRNKLKCYLDVVAMKEEECSDFDEPIESTSAAVEVDGDDSEVDPDFIPHELDTSTEPDVEEFINLSDDLYQFVGKNRRGRLIHCKLCENQFTSRKSFLLHQRKHKNKLENLEEQSPKPKVRKKKPVLTEEERLVLRTCADCNKVFEKPSLLKRHVRKIHSPVPPTPVLCPQCQKPFKRQETLQRHMQIHNESSKIFKCDYCEKAFRRKADLQVHQRIHTGAKEILCSLCGVNFRHEWSFRRHNILLHGVEPKKAYVCEVCGKSFKIKWLLDQHLMAKSHGGGGLPKRQRNNKTKQQQNNFISTDSFSTPVVDNVNYIQ